MFSVLTGAQLPANGLHVNAAAIRLLFDQG
jgi:hypothetical protein